MRARLSHGHRAAHSTRQTQIASIALTTLGQWVNRKSSSIWKASPWLSSIASARAPSKSTYASRAVSSSAGRPKSSPGNIATPINANSLASSIVLVCRPRAANAPTATRREFLAALKVELPAALIHLQRGNIAPVDLAQAAIGPGMAVYTRYAKVLDALFGSDAFASLLEDEENADAVAELIDRSGRTV